MGRQDEREREETHPCTRAKRVLYIIREAVRDAAEASGQLGGDGAGMDAPSSEAGGAARGRGVGSLFVDSKTGASALAAAASASALYGDDEDDGE